MIFTAGAALVLASVVPTMAGATSKSTTSNNAGISAQGLDNEITAQGKDGKRGKRGKHGKREGKRGKRDGRHRHGYHRHHHDYDYDYHYYGGHRRYYGHPYYYGGHPYYGGYYGGGYGCNYDYPCGGQTYDCTRYRGRDGKPVQDPHCKYDARCDCYYHTSERQTEGSQPPPAPDQSAQPAPDPNAQPAPEQGPAPQPQPGGQPQPY